MSDHQQFMQRALELAMRGEGHVEPNPMVGSVIVDVEGLIVGEGWHEKYGGPHAEVNALADAGERARGATMYVTLEPCCHSGKTPPCTRAVRDAGIARVVVATLDPFPEVNGGGLTELSQAGIICEVGVCEFDARDLLAPYLRLVESGRPWVIAKWAMTLDGKIATRAGDSQWISCEQSRSIVHELRGRVDAVVVGARTAERDDPLLTARRSGKRTATRVVVGEVATDSRLAQSINEAPLIVATSQLEEPDRYADLIEQGAEVIWLAPDRLPGRESQVEYLLNELGRRRMTNILVEGGGGLLGTFMDIGAIDEVHVFVAPKIIGGREATTPVAGMGLDTMAEALRVDRVCWKSVGDDLYFRGRVRRE